MKQSQSHSSFLAAKSAPVVEFSRAGRASAFARSARSPRAGGSNKSLTMVAATAATAAFIVWMVSFDARTESLYASRAAPANLGAQSQGVDAPPSLPAVILAFQDRAAPLGRGWQPTAAEPNSTLR